MVRLQLCLCTYLKIHIFQCLCGWLICMWSLFYISKVFRKLIGVAICQQIDVMLKVTICVFFLHLLLAFICTVLSLQHNLMQTFFHKKKVTRRVINVKKKKYKIIFILHYFTFLRYQKFRTLSATKKYDQDIMVVRKFYQKLSMLKLHVFLEQHSGCLCRHQKLGRLCTVCSCDDSLGRQVDGFVIYLSGGHLI